LIKHELWCENKYTTCLTAAGVIWGQSSSGLFVVFQSADGRHGSVSAARGYQFTRGPDRTSVFQRHDRTTQRRHVDT